MTLSVLRMPDRRYHSSSSNPDIKKCHLCASEPCTAYSRPSSWPNDTLQWVEKVCLQSIPSEALVCRACEIFIKRNTGKTNIIPRWILKDARLLAHSYCIVEGCSETLHTTTFIVSYEVAKST